MPNEPSLEDLFNQIIELTFTNFSDIVIGSQLILSDSGSIEKLRVFLKDETFIDVWLSTSGKYAYHWEQRHVRGLIHRHDNAPHSKWKKINTFPKHYHDGKEDNVKESDIPDDPLSAMDYFLSFARNFMKNLR